MLLCTHTWVGWHVPLASLGFLVHFWFWWHMFCYSLPGWAIGVFFKGSFKTGFKEANLRLELSAIIEMEQHAYLLWHLAMVLLHVAKVAWCPIEEQSRWRKTITRIWIEWSFHLERWCSMFLKTWLIIEFKPILNDLGHHMGISTSYYKKGNLQRSTKNQDENLSSGKPHL